MVHDPQRVVYIGETDRRGTCVRFGIREKDRARHIYIIGQTGTGKSTFLETMAVQDIANGEGMIFMDPHGQSAEKLLSFIPESRIEDTIYLAPHLQDCPIGLNIMEDIGYDKRNLVVNSLIASFHKLWGEGSWSDRMEYILTNTLLALIEYPDTTLLDISRMYSNKTFRKNVVDNVKDPVVRKYWVEEFANYTDRFAQEATPAIQNKIGQFTSSPLMRNIIGQKKSSFDFREAMDSGKIIIVNLSKGQVGENDARMLGVLFTTKVYLAALSRADMALPDLAAAPSCNFYVDEFQSFANSSFADILSEARKYKLNLVLAHQYIGQIDSDETGDRSPIRDAVFGNVGTFISFRVGPVDAEIVSKQFGPNMEDDAFVSLPRYHIYLTLNIDGTPSLPFMARTIPPPAPPAVSLVDKVIQRSCERYGADRNLVEKEIKEKMESDQEDKQKDKEGGKKKGHQEKGRGRDRPHSHQPMAHSHSMGAGGGGAGARDAGARAGMGMDTGVRGAGSGGGAGASGATAPSSHNRSGAVRSDRNTASRGSAIKQNEKDRAELRNLIKSAQEKGLKGEKNREEEKREEEKKKRRMPKKKRKAPPTDDDDWMSLKDLHQSIDTHMADTDTYMSDDEGDSE